MNVLIAVDGSNAGTLVARNIGPLLDGSRHAVALMTVLDTSELHGLSIGGRVTPALPDDAGDADSARRVQELHERAVDRIEAGVRDSLQEMAREYLPGVDCEVLVCTGERAAERIIEEATRRDAGLIVIGTHGRGGFRRELVGSVADAVVRASPTPVLLVSTGAGEAPA